MKKIFLLLSLLFINVFFSQENLLKIANVVSNEETTIKENKRIRVITADGKKLSGRFHIVDENSIMIKNTVINLDSIVKLKRHPLLLSLITDYHFIYFGSIIVGAAIIVAAYAQEVGVLVFAIPGILMIHAGWKGVNFLGSYKIKDNWKYEIQMNKTVVNPEILPIPNP